MRNNSRNSIFKEKSFLALTLLSVFALAGVVTVASIISKKQSEKSPYINLNETTDNQFAQADPDEQESTGNEDESNAVADNGDDEQQGVLENPTQDAGQPVDVSPIALMFSAEDTLAWPVEGNVVLEFSMNSSIYFPTLDQYKYNPAMLIQSEVNTPVKAAADCVVTKVGSNEEIGTYVVMSLGGDYELTYGQLKSLEVSEGDTMQAGEIIGYVNEPTKYYLVEGCNLYVKLTHAGEPVDPLDYIE